MRVLRVQTNPAKPDEKVPDYVALDSGVMRWLKPGKVYEASSDTCRPDTMDTLRKALRNGTLVAADADTAKAAGLTWKAPAASKSGPKPAEG